MSNSEKYDELISEITKNRQAMGEMLDTAVTFRKQIDTMIPSSTDFKKKWLLEEKMKLVVSIFNVELDIRKQTDASLKSELELRRKVSGEEMTKSVEEVWSDSKSLARALEQLEGRKHPVFSDEIPSDE